MSTCGECRNAGFGCPNFTPSRCPLPRVGSKEWGWDIRGRLVVPELGYEYEIKEHSPQEIQATVVGERGMFFRTIGTWLLDLDIARSICELHARREWMRKNKPRKG